MVGLNGLMENWIRSLGEVKPKRDSEATSGQEETPTHTTSKRKSRKEVSHYFVLQYMRMYFYLVVINHVRKMSRILCSHIKLV